MEATKSSPEIHFDYAQNILEIRGKSYPENTAELYGPVLAWMKEYLKQLEDFIGSIIEDKSAPTSGLDGLRTLDFVDTCYNSLSKKDLS